MLVRFSVSRANDPTSDLRPGEVALPLWPARGWRLVLDRGAWWRFLGDWRKLVAAGLALLVALYLLAATALHGVWRSRPGNEVRWIDLVLAPVRWDELRERRGRTAIAGAIRQIEQGDLAGGYFELNAGVTRAPGDVRGRLLLVRIIGPWDPERTLSLLDEGLRRAPEEPDLWRQLLAFLASQRADRRLDAETARLLAERPPGPLRALALAARLEFLVARERGAEAEAAVAAAAPGDLTPATEAWRLRALADSGRVEEARRRFPDWARAAAPAEAAALDAELALAARDEPRLASAIRRLKVEQPDSVAPLLFAFRAWHGLGRLTLRDGVEAEILDNHEGDIPALQTYGSLLSELGLAEHLKRLLNRAVASGLHPFAFRVLLTEEALRRGDAEGAFHHLQEWEWQLASVPVAQRAYPELLRRLVRAVQETGAGGPLLNHLRTLRGQAGPEHLVAVLDILERADRTSTALEAARLAARFFPLADLFPPRLAALEARIAAAEAERAARAVAAAAEQPDRPEGPEALAAIDGALARGAYVEARARLNVLRAARPAEAPAETDLRRLHLAVLTDEAVAARPAIRAFLGAHRRPEDAEALARLAVDLMARGRTVEARLLRAEVAAARGSLPEVAAILATMGPDEVQDALNQGPQAFAAMLDERLARSDPDGVIDALGNLRRADPAWRSDAEPALARREHRARRALGQDALADLLFRDLVRKTGAPRASAFALVRELIAEGQRDVALTLARSVVALLPGDRAAARLLQEAELPSAGESRLPDA